MTKLTEIIKTGIAVAIIGSSLYVVNQVEGSREAYELSREAYEKSSTVAYAHTDPLRGYHTSPNR